MSQPSQSEVEKVAEVARAMDDAELVDTIEAARTVIAIWDKETELISAVLAAGEKFLTDAGVEMYRHEHSLSHNLSQTSFPSIGKSYSLCDNAELSQHLLATIEAKLRQEKIIEILLIELSSRSKSAIKLLVQKTDDGTSSSVEVSA